MGLGCSSVGEDLRVPAGSDKVVLLWKPVHGTRPISLLPALCEPVCGCCNNSSDRGLPPGHAITLPGCLFQVR